MTITRSFRSLAIAVLAAALVLPAVASAHGRPSGTGKHDSVHHASVQGRHRSGHRRHDTRGGHRRHDAPHAAATPKAAASTTPVAVATPEAETEARTEAEAKAGTEGKAKATTTPVAVATPAAAASTTPTP